MAALVVIQYKDNYCFLIEKDVIKPFGGGYHFLKPIPFPVTLEKPQSLDLRFTTETKFLSEVEVLFNSPFREATPLRELQEELSEENSILTITEFQQHFLSKNLILR